jgi:transcriptional regulator with XRE-family HTH domain
VTRRKETPTALGAWVRQVRESKGLTQEAFGARIQPNAPVHATTVTRWERANMGLSYRSIELIRKAFPDAPPLPSASQANGHAVLPWSQQPTEPFGPALPPPPWPLRRTLGSLEEVLDWWARSAGMPALTEDFRFMDGLADLYRAYEKRRRRTRRPRK